MSDALAALDRTFRLARSLTGQTWSDQQILGALTSTSVAIVADEQNLESGSGQSCISTLFSLVAACGCSIKLVMPNGHMSSSQPPLAGERIRDALLDLGSDIIPGLEPRSAQQTSDRDLVFVIGDTPWAGQAKQSWRLSGTDWSGGISAITSPDSRWVGSFPVGAGIAAAMAAAEPFKAALRQLVIPADGRIWSLQPVQSAHVGFPEIHTVNQRVKSISSAAAP